MESSDNPFRAPNSDTLVPPQRRHFEIDPLRAVENHLSILFNMTLTLIVTIAVLFFGRFAASLGYRSLYHLSMMATIPLAIAMYMIPVHAWSCAKHCESLLGCWSGRLSAVVVPLVALIDRAPNGGLMSPMVAVAIAGFAAMLMALAVQMDARSTATAAFGNAVLAVGLAGLLTTLPSAALRSPSVRSLHGVLFVGNLVLLFLVRRRCRRALWERRYARTGPPAKKSDPSG